MECSFALEPTKLLQVCKNFQRYKLLLLGLDEVRWADSGEVTTTAVEKLIFSANKPTQGRENSIGFFLSKPAC